MPNKVKVTKDEILNESIKIVRESGMDSLNARLIAKRLNCSIQPVYYHFPTMNELRNAVKKEIRKIYNEYILSSEKSNGKHFREVGFAYLKFAKLEKNFFKILFMNDDNNKLELNANVDENYEYILNTVVEEYGISREDATIVYENLWVTTHGLAVMIATGFANPEPQEISKILANTCKGMILLVKKGELV